MGPSKGEQGRELCIDLIPGPSRGVPAPRQPPGVRKKESTDHKEYAVRAVVGPWCAATLTFGRNSLRPNLGNQSTGSSALVAINWDT